MLELTLLIFAACAVWVYFDSKSLGARRGLVAGIADMGPIGWAAATLLLWVIAFPLYLAKRAEIREAATRRPTPRRSPITGR